MDKMFTQATIEKGSFNDEEQSFVAWASKPVLDRDGEIIAHNAWDIDNYLKNPVLLWAHNYSMPPVGKTMWAKLQKNGLKFKPQFAPTDMGQELYMLYRTGFLNSFSVGFDPKDYEDDEENMIEYVSWFGGKDEKPLRTFTDVELLEISCVPVPACPVALVERAKNGEIKTKGLAKAIIETAVEDGVLKPLPNEHACRLRDPDDFQDGSFRRVTRESDGKEYSIIMGRLEGETTLTEQAYRYKKDIWAAGEARSHCTRHDGSFEAAGSEDTHETIVTSAGEVEGTWEAEEIEQTNPIERIREDGLAKAVDGIVPVSIELWNDMLDNTKLLSAQLPKQPDFEAIEDDSEEIEYTDQEFGLLVKERLKTRKMADMVKELSHSMKVLKAEINVMRGGVG